MKYKPIVVERGKWITELTSRHGGIDDQRKFKEGVEMIEYASEHFRRPTLCHICFTHATKAIYLAVVKRFCRALTEHGIRYLYKACIERERMKGEHFHLMLVLEHRDDGRPLYGTVSHAETSLLGQAVGWFRDSSNIKYRVNRSTYAGGPFLHITKTRYEPFNEAIEWLSYIYKARSKQDVGTTYFSSRRRSEQSETSSKAGFFSSDQIIH